MQTFKQICASWHKAGASIIGITDLESVYGLRVESDPATGRVLGATLDNEPITLTQALTLRYTLSNARLWINTESGVFGYENLDPVMANCLIDSVKNNVLGVNHG
jgi:hypothetical protein